MSGVTLLGMLIDEACFFACTPVLLMLRRRVMYVCMCQINCLNVKGNFVRYADSPSLCLRAMMVLSILRSRFMLVAKWRINCVT